MKKSVTRAGTALLVLLSLATGCSQLKELTPADRKYIFLPEEVELNPFANYHANRAWDDVSYIFYKTFSRSRGFEGVYGTIFEDASGKKIRFLSSVNINATAEQAKKMYASMTPEPSRREFGKEAEVDPGQYGADAAYLYVADSGYFHLVLRSTRIVCSVLVDGAVITERQVRLNLSRKLEYVRQNLDSIR